MSVTALDVCVACPESRRLPCTGPCECAADAERRDVMVLSRFGICPLNKFTREHKQAEAIRRAKLAQGSRPDPKEWGPKKWAELHRFTLTPEAHDLAKFVAFIAEWRQSIPSLGCACRNELDAYLKDHHPGGADPFEWSVSLHNAISAKLGKAQWTVEEARARWS